MRGVSAFFGVLCGIFFSDFGLCTREFGFSTRGSGSTIAGSVSTGLFIATSATSSGSNFTTVSHASLSSTRPTCGLGLTSSPSSSSSVCAISSSFPLVDSVSDPKPSSLTTDSESESESEEPSICSDACLLAAACAVGLCANRLGAHCTGSFCLVSALNGGCCLTGVFVFLFSFLTSVSTFLDAAFSGFFFFTLLWPFTLCHPSSRNVEASADPECSVSTCFASLIRSLNPLVLAPRLSLHPLTVQRCTSRISGPALGVELDAPAPPRLPERLGVGDSVAGTSCDTPFTLTSPCIPPAGCTVTLTPPVGVCSMLKLRPPTMVAGATLGSRRNATSAASVGSHLPRRA
mmetsp:Transcript_5008/g.20459  ORF Transcript_5008/g.20459 Transcript_5008/m.20459 type:complete len:347 (-) Transcript_5008:72-1112(-)